MSNNKTVETFDISYKHQDNSRFFSVEDFVNIE